MAETTSADNTTTNVDTGRPSVFALKFNITDIESNPAGWNRDWEKALRTLSSIDVYRTLSFNLGGPGEDLSQFSEAIQEFKKKIYKDQEVLGELWDDTKLQPHICTAWPLLEEGERQRHLFNGFKESCKHVFAGQDSRAFCPEITLSAMLRRMGHGFIDFLNHYWDGKKEAGVGNVYLLPSEWWDKVVEDLPQPLSEPDQLSFELLTLFRNEFICESVAARIIQEIEQVILSQLDSSCIPQCRFSTIWLAAVQEWIPCAKG
jgi:hypothetical protein